MNIFIWIILVFAAFAALQAAMIALTIASGRNFMFFKNYNTGKVFVILIIFRLLVMLKVKSLKLIRIFISINNRLLGILNRCKGNKTVLILLPRCLQNQSCAQVVVDTVKNCKGCGKCDLAEIGKINYTEQTKVLVATGGEIAKDFITREMPDMIIAVACERELFQGLSEIRKLPVYALLNDQPEGPCKNTRVDVESIRKALTLAGVMG